MAKTAYFCRSLAAQFTKTRFSCPNCGSALNSTIDRKYLITQLRRCGSCQLLFRTPTDDPANNLSFYENEYRQGFTTGLPTDAALAEMKQSNFAGTEKDYSYYLGVLKQLGLKLGSSVFDYGCSWGYGSYQLVKAGFEVVSFEVAPSRSRYAHEKLGIQTVSDMNLNGYSNHFDCFFSAHVLEHIPAPAKAFDYAIRLLKRDGLFVSFTPNGSSAHRATSPNSWSKAWGEVHPNFIDEIFLDRSFERSRRIVGSSPVTNPSLPEQIQLKRVNKLDGGELFFCAQRSGDTWS
jgi:2-polyprenyl-3-methyl-5-hydroxy-6-metoxy-1,4-benzoquinol methylase